MNTSTAPAVLQVNGKTIRFMANTGLVDKVSKRVETKFNASASGGGTQQYGRTVVSTPTTLNVSSTNTTVTELWMRDGDKELDHTLSSDLSVRENQKVSILMVSGEHGENRQYVGVLNYNTGTWQTLNTLDHMVRSLVMPPLGTIIYFLLCAGAVLLCAVHWLVTLLAFGGIIYLATTRSTKMKEAREEVNRQVAEMKQWLIDTNGV
ncbi:hypothetical protein [Fibrella forsythiae]|uniref:Uncharacterized protein n=1 Tax=Fibrella forsythiae TaxID=2817061 RepID=A0ABS3JLL4_9BACT|nr:hypothetical protein [Fibrella forsythiae]MBO0950904.1 hypothetical protein [Fibrella forsythiae]